jgi:hypothetical protein
MVVLELILSWLQLGLSKLKLAPYNLHMANQTIANPLGLMKYFKIIVHGIPYVMTFIVIHNSVLDSNYFMLLGHPWLRDVKVSHDWGNNIIIIQGTGTIRTIPIIKKLGPPTKHLEILVCYNFHSRIFDEKNDLMFVTKPLSQP